ncbi:hypothetical protein [Mycobacterium sp.]|uniref:hypothetical protein n=1 Tax=Mycobacterium sp. TaxID=1785 RepID=UPI003F99C5FA
MVTNNLASNGDEPTPEGGPGFTGVDVGVIGVAATATVDPPHPPRSSWLAVQDYVALLSDRTPMHAVALPLSPGDVGAVGSAITGHRTRLSAAFVVGLGAPESAAVQRWVAEAAGQLVIAEIDVVTAAQAGAVMAMLRSRGVQHQRARVAMAGAESAPLLGPILIACGIGELTSWHPRDAQHYPLNRLMEHNDIVICPKAAAPMLVAWDRPVTIPHDPFDFGALVLPGLLGALCGHGVGELDVLHLAAAAHAVALVTPSLHVLPELNDPRLVSAIAHHVSQTLTDQHR